MKKNIIDKPKCAKALAEVSKAD